MAARGVAAFATAAAPKLNLITDNRQRSIYWRFLFVSSSRFSAGSGFQRAKHEINSGKKM
jgi:hypothetical protein